MANLTLLVLFAVAILVAAAFLFVSRIISLPPQGRAADYINSKSKNKQRIIACIGDSLTHGNIGQSWVDYLRQEFPNDVFDDNQDFGQNLFAEETRPESSSAEGGFDATLEEVLHLITHVGYANAYPNKYGEDPGSDLTKAMDKARGGQFFDIPSRYPAGAWYTYDDDSCNYNCMATEYFYWALTSLLGAQSYIGREDEIKHEWRLSSARKVELTDEKIYNLLSTLPIKVIPTGKYSGSLLTIKSIN